MSSLEPIFLRAIQRMKSSSFVAVAVVCTTLGTSACDRSEETCLDNDAFFRERVQQQVLEPVCMACHVASGSARESDLVLSTIVVPNYLDINQASMSNMAGLERDGESWLLRKPLGFEDHGGGAILSEDSPEYQILVDYVARLENPVTCEQSREDEESEDVGLVLASPADTLRRASMRLAGRLPSPDESEFIFTHGEEGLGDALDLIMQDEEFVEIMKEDWNDVLLTDKYHPCCGAIGLVDYDRFYNLYWYEGKTNRNTKRSHLNKAIAREPLELIGYVLKEGKPFSEILTADYTMVNAYSGMSYGVTYDEPDIDDPTTFDYFPAHLDGIPHAGILSTPAYLNRFPTTATNRNRHRAWAFYNNFLSTDILQMADRPIDITESEVHNPTLNDPQCNICHAVMEPVSGLFQNWDNDGHYNPPDEGWYPEMFSPGFGSAELPTSNKGEALQWLAQQTVSDARFALAISRQAYTSLTGLPVINPAEANLDPLLKEAWLLQSVFLERVSTRFRETDYNYRELLKDIILSHYYRAVDDAGATEGALLLAGTAQLLTPEKLNRKIKVTTGFTWRRSRTSTANLLDRYEMLYGGIDSNSVTERLREPNGIIANIGLRMATEVSCLTVSQDFAIPKDQRRLFPWVEVGYQPITADGLPVPEAERRIRKNIQYLHYRLTGEHLEVDSIEIDETYALWLSTWQEGRARVTSGEESQNLHHMCDVTTDYWTNETLPVEDRVYQDPDYTIRAWMAVMTYELSDYRFLFE